MSHRVRTSLLPCTIAAVFSLLLGTGLTLSAALDPQPQFVNAAGRPLTKAPLRVVCYEDSASTTPLADLLIDTDNAGRPVQVLPTDCNYIAALHIRHRQPSGKPGRDDAYWVYDTSWQPGTRDLLTATGRIPIREEWRLVLFDVSVSMEWEPDAAGGYVADLTDGFARASAYLYDLTDGQMAIGPFAVTTSGAGWNGADVRVRAANDYRPTAQVGGMVATATAYTATGGAESVFAPGEIYLSRYWDGFDGTDPEAGRWTAPAAYRTLVHEWMHYALFLYDQYQDADEDGRTETYCTCRDLPLVGEDGGACGGIGPDRAASAMAYHYTASELWLEGLEPACFGTDQQTVHGEPDWDTLTHWGAIQGLTDEWLRKPEAVSAGPATGLAGDLFARRPLAAPLPVQTDIFLPLVRRVGSGSAAAMHAQHSAQSTHAITLSVVVSDSLDRAARNALHPQLYVRIPASGTRPARILHQGTTVGARDDPAALGDAPLLGVQPDSDLHLFIERYGPRGAPLVRYRHTENLGADPAAAKGRTITATVDGWPVSLNIAPVMEGPRLRALTLTLTSGVSLPVSPTVQLCIPDDTVGCPADGAWRATFAAGNAMTGTATLTATLTATPDGEIPHYGVLHVDAPGAGHLLRWYQAPGGVGPAHMFGEAPLRDGPVMVDAIAETPGAQNRVVIMPAADYAAVTAPLPLGIDGLIGPPLDIDVRLPISGSTSDAPPRVDRTLPTPVIFTLFHGQEALDRQGLNKAQLHVVHFNRAARAWQLVPSSGRSDALNWIATEPVAEDGIYAVAWSPVPDLEQTPRKLADPGPVAPGEPIRYLLLLPGPTDANQPRDAFIADPLPPIVQLAQQPICNVGECFFDPVSNGVFWQGALQTGELAVVAFDVVIDPELPASACPPQLDNQAQAFDGVQEHQLNAVTLVECAGRVARG